MVEMPKAVDPDLNELRKEIIEKKLKKRNYRKDLLSENVLWYIISIQIYKNIQKYLFIYTETPIKRIINPRKYLNPKETLDDNNNTDKLTAI